MSQPHPPIPEPQPHGEPHPEPEAGTGPPTGSTAASLSDDDPRTQSILLPPSQRQDAPPVDPQPLGQPPVPGPATGSITAQSAPAATGVLPAQPGPEATSPSYQPSYEPSHQPSYEASYEPSRAVSYQPDPQAGWQSGPQPDAQAGWQPGPQPSWGAGHQPSYDAQVTGPVDFVPGSPSASGHPAGSTTAPPPPASGPSTSAGSAPGDPAGSPLDAVRRAGRDRTLLLGIGLVVLALVLLEIGLALDFGNLSLWEVVPTWSAFATVAVLVVLVPFVARLAGRALAPGAAWRIGAAGLAALAAFWVLVALPLVASDRGFWLTAALGAAGAALWLAPGRSR